VKKQKAYNFEQKDFLSAPNQFHLREIGKVFSEEKELLPRSETLKFPNQGSP
jgi:hypothetical protein